LRPLERTKGLADEPGTPGAPKCLTVSRWLLGPRSSTVPVPVGAASASWSNVSTSPPAATMRARAVSVTPSAHSFSLGTSARRTSSVTLPTSTAVCDSLPFMNVASLLRLSGGRLMRLMNSRFSTTLQNLLSVRRARNLYSFTSSFRYTLSLFGAVRCVFLLRPPAIRSIPILRRGQRKAGERRDASALSRRTACNPRV